MSSFYIQEFDKKTVVGSNQRFLGVARHGKTTEQILCPFCEKKTTAYTWSLSGGGKKCDHCENTLHTTINSQYRCKTEQQALVMLAELQEKE